MKLILTLMSPPPDWPGPPAIVELLMGAAVAIVIIYGGSQAIAGKLFARFARWVCPVYPEIF